MSHRVRAIVDRDGTVRLLEEITLDAPRRAVLTILDEKIDDDPHLPAVASEASLAEDWNRMEEDEAWQHLQPEA